eukprot:COSAG01_NODE_258_length_20077_cov_124.162429_33_plen_156_part_00
MEGEGLALLHRAVGWARSAAAAGGGGGELGERGGGVGGGGFEAAVDALERRSTGLRLTLTPLADGLPALQVSVPSFRRVGWGKPAAAAAATGGGATLGTVRRFFFAAVLWSVLWGCALESPAECSPTAMTTGLLLPAPSHHSHRGASNQCTSHPP